MADSPALGQIVILNGAPRSGKSSIAAVIQDTFDGPWMNLGVDAHMSGVMPRRHSPGIYDLEVDTSAMSPAQCAQAIRDRLAAGPPPTAAQRLAAMAEDHV